MRVEHEALMDGSQKEQVNIDGHIYLTVCLPEDHSFPRMRTDIRPEGLAGPTHTKIGAGKGRYRVKNRERSVRIE